LTQAHAACVVGRSVPTTWCTGYTEDCTTSGASLALVAVLL
jgi:hypothetical protein